MRSSTLLIAAYCVLWNAQAQENQGIGDSASNDTRELCIAMVGWALPAVGAVDGLFEEMPDMLIHAHTIREEGLNCFMTVNDVPYLIFARLDGPDMTGLRGAIFDRGIQHLRFSRFGTYRVAFYSSLLNNLPHHDKRRAPQHGA